MGRVVITGLGILNSLGEGVPTVWRRIVAGENGIRRIGFFDASEYRCKVAAEIDAIGECPRLDRDSYAKPSPLGSLSQKQVRRGVAVFLECAREAFCHSGLAQSGVAREDVGVAAGASVAFIDHELTAEYYRLRRPDGADVDLERFAADGCQPDYTFARRLGDLAASLPAKVLDLRGPQIVVDTACAASGHAVGEAFRRIRNGVVPCMVVGGATALVSPIGILYFAVLGALSQNPDPETASRPFDKERDGFVMGEGGAAVVLEDYEHARARGATIYAELAGFGSNTCAINLTDPSPDGSVEARAMQLALEDGRVAAEEIGYVAAHGTSTQKNDAAECKAIRRVFGGRARDLLVSSNKGQVGHTISGSAITNLVLTIQALREGIVPPTVHLRTPDPELDLDFVPNEARRRPVSAALVNSFAFGGHNAVLAVRACAG